MKNMLFGIAIMLLGMSEVVEVRGFYQLDELVIWLGFALCAYEFWKENKSFFKK